MKRWNPPQVCTPREQALLKRLVRTRKLFAFLRLYRHELFDEGFQAELEDMYRQTGAGEEPVPPALLCMALLLQGYLGVSDAEAVELTVVDRRWQLVLGRLGEDAPAFAQGTLQQFRERLIRHELDRRLLERTVEVARRSQGFDPKKLPKSLRLGVDSRPLEGAGRVEDTFNLLGHAARLLVRHAARLAEQSEDQVCKRAQCPLFSPRHKSLKAALDIDWSDESAKQAALTRVSVQLGRLERWVRRRGWAGEPKVAFALGAAERVLEQDTAPAPGGGVRLTHGTARERRVSVADEDMRHGRKSQSKRFDGFKAHAAESLDEELVLACALLPGNRQDAEAGPALEEDLAHQQAPPITEAHVDRAYVASSLTRHVQEAGGRLIAKPRVAGGARGLFGRADFRLDQRHAHLVCPAGERARWAPGHASHFPREACAGCALRPVCTRRALPFARVVQVPPDDLEQEALRRLQRTRPGRALLRQRTGIEHCLAHLTHRQGRRARYRGLRKNLFDLRRAACLHNLETTQRKLAA